MPNMLGISGPNSAQFLKGVCSVHGRRGVDLAEDVGVDDSSTVTGWVAQRQSAPLECRKSQVRSLVWPFFSLPTGYEPCSAALESPKEIRFVL